MNVVFVNRYFYPDHSATSQLLSDLAFGLATLGHAVHVVTSRQRYDQPLASLSPREQVNGVRVHRVWTTRFGRSHLAGRALDYFTFYISAGLRLALLLQRGDIVVAKTDPPLISVVAAVAARVRGARLINWLQDVFPEVAEATKVKFLSGWISRFVRKLRNWSLRSGAATVVLGAGMADYVSRHAVPGKSVTIVPNWSGELPEQNPSDIADLRAEWGLTGDFVVMYSGNMGRVHEFDTVLGAAELLRDAGVTFLFVGGGYRKALLLEETIRRQLPNFVFMDYQPRETLALSLAVGDVHLITLLPELEGFVVPSKFYGVAAAGKPSLFVGNPEGEIARLVREVECGAAVATGDSESLATAIRHLMQNPALSAHQGEKALKAYRERFAFAHALEKWHSLLTTVGQDKEVLP